MDFNETHVAINNFYSLLVVDTTVVITIAYVVSGM